jgi:hypothetical protein
VKRCCHPATAALLVGGAGAGHHAKDHHRSARSPGVTVPAASRRSSRTAPLPPSNATPCSSTSPAPQPAIEQLERVLAPGGHLHVAVLFNHPFHEYPADFQRWTADGLRRFLGRLRSSSWRPHRSDRHAPHLP